MKKKWYNSTFNETLAVDSGRDHQCLLIPPGAHQMMCVSWWKHTMPLREYHHRNFVLSNQVSVYKQIKKVKYVKSSISVVQLEKLRIGETQQETILVSWSYNKKPKRRRDEKSTDKKIVDQRIAEDLLHFKQMGLWSQHHGIVGKLPPAKRASYMGTGWCFSCFSSHLPIFPSSC